MKEKHLWIILGIVSTIMVSSLISGQVISKNYSNEKDLRLFLVLNFIVSIESTYEINIQSNATWLAAISFESDKIYDLGNANYRYKGFYCSFNITLFSSGYLTVELLKDNKLIYSNTTYSISSPLISKNGNSILENLLQAITVYPPAFVSIFEDLVINDDPSVIFTVISGITGIITVIVGLILYHIHSIGKEEESIIPEQKKEPISEKELKQKPRLFTIRCPDCGAPIKKELPCECDYCGRKIDRL